MDPAPRGDEFLVIAEDRGARPDHQTLRVRAVHEVAVRENDGVEFPTPVDPGLPDREEPGRALEPLDLLNGRETCAVNVERRCGNHW